MGHLLVLRVTTVIGIKPAIMKVHILQKGKYVNSQNYRNMIYQMMNLIRYNTLTQKLTLVSMADP